MVRQGRPAPVDASDEASLNKKARLDEAGFSLSLRDAHFIAADTLSITAFGVL